jgi:hypothetical protein
VTFERGTAVALREILRGRVWAARPAIVVADAPDEQMFYVPIGVRWRSADVADRDHLLRTKAKAQTWSLVERTWTDRHVLSWAWAGAGHAVLRFWDERWRPRGWYVNVQEPLRRSPVGFDTLDEDLDLLVPDDRSSWTWKDEDDVARCVELGLYAPDDVERMRSEAARGRDRLLGREPPFDREWLDWRPDPAWPVPQLPPGWDEPPPG